MTRADRFFNETPLYPFGYGLTLTSFECESSWLFLLTRSHVRASNHHPAARLCVCALHAIADAALSLSPATTAGAPLAACASLALSITLCNDAGGRDSDEVAQVYVATPDGALPSPRTRLAAYSRVHVPAGACTRLRWTLPPVAWSAADDGGELHTQAGRVVISVGSGQPGYTPGVLTAVAFAGPSAPLASCGAVSDQLKEYYTPRLM